MTCSQWYAVRTATRRERSTAEALTDKGVPVFLPMETRWEPAWRGRREPNQAPLIPGYLFVLSLREDLAAVEAIEGVHQLVGYYDEDGASRPLAIPAAAIIEIQTAERAGDYDRTRFAKPVYRPRKGETVKVTRGPWLSFIGKVLNTPKRDRALVMIEGPFGRGVTLDVACLSAA